jgi:hypothetical protein
MNLILTALTFSLAIIGLYVSFQWPGMLLRPVKERLDIILPLTLTKPLYNCPICMSSFWTITLGTLACTFDLLPISALSSASTFYQNIALLILLIPAVAGINTFLCIALDRLTDYGC